VIRTQAEYEEARRRLALDRDVAAQQRAALVAANLTPEDVERAMQPLLSFQAQLEEELAWYEAVRARRIPAIRNLTQLGRLLIALRIAQGLTQRDLAARLGVNESAVSRDERNEYHGITLERAQKVIEALGVPIATGIDEPGAVDDRELVPA
jgi:DNA-directed RNA polymerase specialized sigma subunit